VAGVIVPESEGYRITTRLLDPGDGRVIGSGERRARARAEVLSAVGQLALEQVVDAGDDLVEQGFLVMSISVEKFPGMSAEKFPDQS
jgi:hypothetical protein